MSTAAALAERLFRMPGEPCAHTTHLLAQAASVHAHLLARASTNGLSRARPTSTIAAYLKSHAAAADKRRLLDDPLLVEALHTLAPSCASLADWDQAVASREAMADAATCQLHGMAKLGNVALALLLRADAHWRGAIDVASDALGVVRFPASDWSVTLVPRGEDPVEPTAHRTVLCVLDEHDAKLFLPSHRDATPVLALARGDFVQLVIDGEENFSPRSLRGGHASVRARLHRANRLGASGIRFDPVHPDGTADHLGLTGAIVEAMLEAMHRNSPGMYAQLCTAIRTIRGFELPVAPWGALESFSTPLAPGVMGFNIPYSDDDEPLLSPYCFTWLGHELGHTLHYLIDEAAYLHGASFVENPGELTPVIPRYQRRLAVRTIFQVPYVHLFEWVLLMDFLDADCAGLPWAIGEDAVAFGDDLGAEIEEAFVHCDQHARLTAQGAAVIAHLRRMARLTARRWRCMREHI